MAKIPTSFDFGPNEELSGEELLRSLQEMYFRLANAINEKPSVIQRNSDGINTETFLSNGDININLTSDKVEMLTNHTSSTNVTWTTLS